MLDDPRERPVERIVERPAERPLPVNVDTSPETPVVQAVSGPSFLGLADEPTKSEFHYLYEDEPPRSYVGLLVVLLIAVGIGGAAYWQWSRHGYPFNQFGNAAQQTAQTSPPSADAPAQTPNPQPPTEKANTAPDVQPTDASPDPNAKASTDQKEVETAAAPAPKPVEEAKATPAPSAPPVHTRAQTAHASLPKPAPRPPATLASASSPAVTAPPDADLELAGERALYGTGVPKNCARAESNLRTAATHSNSKAQTVLGTMYATGHCVGRDLPTAYRWFARALHLDPQNSRISADLQILWRQMSAEERQSATASGQ